MHDDQTVKLGIALAIISALAFVGYFFILFVLPVILLVLLVDLFFRLKHNRLVEEFIKEYKPVLPQLLDFHVCEIQGAPHIAWDAELPASSFIEIYRLTDEMGRNLDDICKRGTMIENSTKPQAITESDFVIDHDAPTGTVIYHSVLGGKKVEKKPIEYPFMSFRREVQYTTRKTNYVAMGSAVRLRRELSVVDIEVLEDAAPYTAKQMANDIVAQMFERKRQEAELEEALHEIDSNHELTEAEKNEAKELLETGSVTI